MRKSRWAGSLIDIVVGGVVENEILVTRGWPKELYTKSQEGREEGRWGEVDQRNFGYGGVSIAGGLPGTNQLNGASHHQHHSNASVRNKKPIVFLTDLCPAKAELRRPPKIRSAALVRETGICRLITSAIGRYM